MHKKERFGDLDALDADRPLRSLGYRLPNGRFFDFVAARERLLFSCVYDRSGHRG